MRPLLICGFTLGLFLATGVRAQSSLPASLSGWKSSNGTTVTPSNLNVIAGAATPALLEYGATNAEKCTYANNDDSRRTLTATVFVFRDASGAYGAYSYLRTPEMIKADFSDHSVKSRDRALVLLGNMLLEVDGSGIADENTAIKKLVSSLGRQALAPVYPSLPLRLPTANLIPRTDHYFLGPVALAQFWPDTNAKGDWLGFWSGAEAETAKYRLEGHDATLLVADFPTPQIAARQMERMSTEFRINGGGPSASKLYARRDGTLIALLAGAPSADAANSLLDRIQSDVIVTWNEPVLKHPQPSMAAIVVGSIVGTGEICLFTIFGGVLFTLIRLGVKKLLPGKIFDRPQQFEILQIGLTSKPIKSKDFY